MPSRTARLLYSLTAVMAFTLGLVVGVPSVSGPRASAATTVTTIGSKEVEATFTNPTAGPNPGDVVPDPSIINQLDRLIANTPGGQSIHLAIYHLSRPEVYNALYDAVVNRHVNVYLVHDHSDNGKVAQQVAAIPGIHNTWCDHGAAATYGTGCLSSNKTGIMHAKYGIFSQTKDAAGVLKPWVSWFGSANETSSTGLNTFNNTVTIYDDQTLYDGFQKFFNDMNGEPFLAGNDYFDKASGRGYFWSGASHTTVYASPEADTDSDLVAAQLARIQPDNSCQVRFMENNIHHDSGVRQAFFDQLARLDAGGCHMYAVAANMDPSARCAFYHDHITSHQDQTGLPNQVSVHDKSIIVHAKFAGSSTYRDIVFTGSHNLTKSALRYNDEIFVKLTDSTPLYQAFYDHFGAAYSKTTTYPVPAGC